VASARDVRDLPLDDQGNPVIPGDLPKC
jgi:hypothetical protein